MKRVISDTNIILRIADKTTGTEIIALYIMH